MRSRRLGPGRHSGAAGIAVGKALFPPKADAPEAHSSGPNIRATLNFRALKAPRP